MPILVDVLAPQSDGVPTVGAPVTAGVPEFYDCPALSRVKAFVVDAGVTNTLEHVLRDAAGRPLDLSLYFTGDNSLSNSGSDSEPAAVLRAKEAIARGSCSEENPFWEIPATVVEPASGLLRAALPRSLTDVPGIYLLGWGVVQGPNDATRQTLANETAILSVERSLFSPVEIVLNGLGPTTLRELRATIRDTSAGENLRLDEVEYSDDEIMQAICRPIEFFNEIPPPIAPFTTRNCPFRETWRIGALSLLYRAAAAWYRRNKQKVVAAGIAQDDLNRDQEYGQEADRLWKEYNQLIRAKKLEINMGLAAGAIGSAFARSW